MASARRRRQLAASGCVHHWRILGTPTAGGYYALCRLCQAESYLPTVPSLRDPPTEELRMRERELALEGWLRRVEWESGEGVLSRLRRAKRLYGTLI
jgi:hypothetical protein